MGKPSGSSSENIPPRTVAGTCEHAWRRDSGCEPTCACDTHGGPDPRHAASNEAFLHAYLHTIKAA